MMIVYKCKFFMSDLIYLLLRKSNFSVDSDLEVKALKEDSLQLLAICSGHFSLASLMLLAKSLAYSVSSSLFFLIHCFFRGTCQCLSCRMCGMTRH